MRAWGAIAAMGLLACGPVASQERAGRPPNIIFILADDLGRADLGCYGQKKIKTPHLDRLAAGGMRFTQAYSGNAVCAPSRCTLMTGLHPGHAFIRDNREVKPEGQVSLPAGTVTVAELLKRAGYATGGVGKWGLGGPDAPGEPTKMGFDRWFGYLCQREAHNFYPLHLWRDGKKVPLEGNDRGLTGKQYSHDLMADEALRFIRDNRSRPFFLYAAFTIPHVALQVPEDSLADYRGLQPDPPYVGGRGYLPHPTPHAAYAAMVSRLDRDVGRIAALVSELGLDRDTLILFSSDNGPAPQGVGGSDSAFFESAGGLRGLKGSLYEGGIRVPLLARWPGRIREGAVTDRATAFWDLLPTFVEAAGAATPPGLDGISLLPTLTGKGDARAHEFLYWEFPSYGGQQAVRLGNWKGVRQRMGRGNLEIELYDLAADPAESRDVAAANPEVVERIRGLMARERAPSKQFPLKPLD